MGRIKDLMLDKNIILKGRWAINFDDLFDDNSTFSDKSKPGNLEITNGHILLDLNGKLYDSTSDFHNEVNTIYGYLNSGLYVILEKCFITNKIMNYPGYIVEVYLANFAYILDENPCELKFQNDNEFLSNKVKFSIDYLDDWYNVDLPNKKVVNSKEFTISYVNDYFKENRFEILNGKYLLSLNRDIKAIRELNKGVRVSFDSYISIYTNDKRTEAVNDFKKITDWTLKFIDFITQTYGKYTYFEFLLEDDINKSRIEKLEDGDYSSYYPKYTGRLIFPQISEKAPALRIESLRLDTIKNDFGFLISSWFENKEKLVYIIDLYYQNRIRTLDIESAVVNKIKMLEAYYNNFMSAKREEYKEKESKVDIVKEKIKDNLKSLDVDIQIQEELIRRLDKKDNKYINLREKITAILESIPYELKLIFYEINSKWEDKKDFETYFAKRLVDTRNYYVHGANNEKHKKRLKSNKEFLLASSILDIVIYYCILNVLGISEEKLLSYPYLREKINLIKHRLNQNLNI